MMITKTLKTLLVLVQWALIAAGVAWVVHAPFADSAAANLLAFYREHYLVLAAVLLLALLIFLPGKIRFRGKKEPLEYIPLNGPEGDIRVSVRVARNTIQECAAKIKAVRSLEPELSWGAEGLSVILRLELERGRPLTTVCADLQDAVREGFRSELGIEQLREVRADIVDLAAAGPVTDVSKILDPKPESVPPPEPEVKPEQGT